MTTLSDAVVAVYISKEGKILATEQIEGGRTIGVNQLDSLPRSSDATEIIECEITVGYKVVSGDCSRSYNYMAQRVCYDKFGRRIPCPFE
ncbi:MAG TPA: hypothetical protein VLS53_02695 [Candidatus Dormibacteraeota bacterium]|nr:hypothetical protein [Candidatus Dormibacteraeota bacterium]